MVDFIGAAIPLTSSGLMNACQRLGVKAAEVWALVFTETDPPYGGFWSDRRPQILYEQHVFHRLTDGQFDTVNPDISSPHSGNYGPSGAHQYERLAAAIALDEAAALRSTSWGIGQTLGENYSIAGYSSPQDMVAQMLYSEDQQLAAGINEILATHAAAPLAAHDWKGFARIYNGPAYAKNSYDASLMGWYAHFSSAALPDIRTRTCQLYLTYLGYDPSTIDGAWGERTRSAMQAFQRITNIPVSDDLDDATFERVVAEGQRLSRPVALAQTRGQPRRSRRSR